jgi:hypothetical protein
MTDRTLGWKRVRLCFYEPRGEDEPLVNLIVAYFGKHYVSHVEIQFADDMAASIYSEDEVFFRKRSYSNPCYVIKGFTVPAKSYDMMYKFCESSATRHIGFSNMKMFLGPLIGYRGSCDRTFCSEFVTHVLQVGGIPFAMKTDASRCTPSVLLERINRSETVCFDTTAFKLGLAFK